MDRLDLECRREELVVDRELVHDPELLDRLVGGELLVLLLDHRLDQVDDLRVGLELLGVVEDNPRLPREGRDVLEVDWPFFGELCRGLALRIAREYEPDLVLGIAKAGVLPGAVVASILGGELAAMSITRKQASGRPTLVSGPSAAVKAHRVLIVDETCDSGDTLKVALAAVRSLGPSEVRTAVTLLSVLSPDDGNSPWWRGPRPDGGGQGGQGRTTERKAMVRIVTADITDPAAVRILGDRNLLQEAGPASDIYVEQYLNGIDPFLFAGCYHGSASWFGGLMGSMPPSGNRLFIQSATHLRCIGDPAVQYDWNPQSRPAHITKTLETKTPSTKGP